MSSSGYLEWQRPGLLGDKRGRSKARSPQSLEFEATLRTMLRRPDDPDITGCWIDRAGKADPIWLRGPAVIVAIGKPAHKSALKNKTHRSR
jgi:hypothetical protein